LTGSGIIHVRREDRSVSAIEQQTGKQAVSATMRRKL